MVFERCSHVWAQTPSRGKAGQSWHISPLSRSRCLQDGTRGCIMVPITSRQICPPLCSTKTGIRQLDLLSRCTTASSLVYISLLPLRLVSFSSLSNGYELLQSLSEQCKRRRQCKEQDTKQTCQNSSESMFTHSAKVWTWLSLSLIKNVNIQQMKA